MHPYKPEIKEIVTMIFKEQNPNQIMQIRNKFYDLLVNCVEGNLILKEMIFFIIESKRLGDENLVNLIHKGAELETTMVQGTKPIVHLECFVANAMEAALK